MIKVRSIWFRWVETPSGKGFTEDVRMYYKTFADAQTQIEKWRGQLKHNSYAKLWFTVIWNDNQTYQGIYEIRKNRPITLGQDIREKFEGNLRDPLLHRAEFLDFCKAFLETYQL